MATVYDTAKYILEKEGRISTWKLQKLCYYAQAWSLAWTTAPIFQEDFEAWSNGPVCPELYRLHKDKFTVNVDDLPVGDSAALTQEQVGTIDSVLESYGSWEPYELREQTHNETPWKDARGDLPIGAPGKTVIEKSVMGEYYGSL